MSTKLKKLSLQTLYKIKYNIGKIPSNLEFKYELLKKEKKNCCND